MELKVWVEGIQRIVCGVNEKTTCQDVVFALAHATGKTGRFTLIERWRNSERLLAPNEQPLKVLMKWGEHSNDVQFILQWAPLDSANSASKPIGKSTPTDSPNYFPFPKTPNSSTPTSNSGSSTPTNHGQPNGPSKISLNNISSSSGGAETPVEANGLKKDTNVRNTLHFRSDVFENGPPSLPQGLANGKVLGHTNKAIFNSGLGTESSQRRRTKDLTSVCPPPYRDPPIPTKLVGLPKELPPYRDPPPPNLRNNNSPVSSLTPNSSISSSSGYVNNLMNQNNSGSGVPNSLSSTFISTNGGTSHKDSPAKLSNVTSQHDISAALPPVTSFGQAQPSDMAENVASKKYKDQSLTNGEISLQMTNGSATPKQSPSVSNSNNPQYRDLIRLINNQREKLTTQQAELTQYDAEIMFWEGKAREQQRHIEFISKEIARLELVSSQHESQVMSLSHIEEESEVVTTESETLKTDLSSLRSELAKCDTELMQCKNRIRILVDDLHTTQQQMNQRQEEWMIRETSTLAEIEKLKKDLEIARRETDAVTDISGSLDKEVVSLESNLNDKKKQMDRLVAAMKEANLQSLTIQPPDEIVDGGTHYRSGSTRRMIGSPRQLENAAPTSKNPHGVWV